MGIVVICSYKPNEGQDGDFLRLLERHHGVLRHLDLITDRPVVYLQSDDRVYLEIFEWVSEEASRGAHDHESVKKIWKKMAQVSDFVPLSTLEEAKTPFAHFTPFEFGH